MKLVMDLVVNYIFDQYLWFLEFCLFKLNLKCDWYIWRKFKYDVEGKLGLFNNWYVFFFFLICCILVDIVLKELNFGRGVFGMDF